MNSMQETILTRLAGSHAPVSGDLLAHELGISRTAVWKHIQQMRRRGIDIAALHGRGYALQQEVFSHGTLSARLHTQRIGRELLLLEETDSTNREAMRRAEEGAADGLTIFAERQSAGRGRLGRRWHTFPGQALAMSIVLRPPLPPERVPQLSLLTAVALHQALSPLAPSLAIKWPNDLLCHGAKLAGILTEMRAEPGQVHAVIVGIGVNLAAPKDGWPDDITQRVTDLSTLAGHSVSRLDVAARILQAMDSLYAQYLNEGFAPIRDAWWQAHAASGKSVRVHDGKDYIVGTAEALDHDGALLLATPEGQRRIVAGDLELMA
jgi:BirA family biotin operon repressor/biotin-[acetyl-CoA-carboxylase] ligase